MGLGLGVAEPKRFIFDVGKNLWRERPWTCQYGEPEFFHGSELNMEELVKLRCLAHNLKIDHKELIERSAQALLNLPPEIFC